MGTKCFRAAAAVLLLSSCARRQEKPQGASAPFAPLVEEFIFSSLALSPVSATAAGYHDHKDASLDEMLDDMSPESIESQRRFYSGFRQRLLEQVKPESLEPEDRADFDILSGQIDLALLELDVLQSFRKNPTVYVELLGNALFNPLVLEYAPKRDRMKHVIARTSKIPAFLDQAKAALAQSPEIWRLVAIEENEGNIELVDKTLRAEMPTDLKPAYERAAAPALKALRGFQSFLKSELKDRGEIEWRLGRDNYAAKFRLTLATGATPEKVLADAEADLESVRNRMLELSLPLHETEFPNHPVHNDLVVKEVLDSISRRHATPQTYFATAKADLAEARTFVQAKSLLLLPPNDNLQVIPTPEFMRGIYAVGGFSSAPALEPELGAFYWITPIPANWPAARVESKLREYNFYKLKLLTIHEAMPGHYVQLEYANQLQPEARRVLRSVFGNGPYIEGWGQYATQVMLDEGYLNNSPELRLTFLKEELRVLANAILDIRLHTKEMGDAEALDLMERRTFQEKEEAVAKLRRAKLSSCQLPTYLVGWREWIRVRERYKKVKGSEYRLHEFNERALKEGAVPMPLLERLLMGESAEAAGK
jgi:uncharacterized protein (DUF885 family)